MSRVCPYCSQPFVPSLFHPAQRVCSQSACQRQRRQNYHRHKIQTDPLYHQVCRESQQKWRVGHPDYPRQYRQTHSDYVRHNRYRQQKRDQCHRLARLVKNNLAFDLKHSSHEVWLMGSEATDLVKNNVACSKVLIFETVNGSLSPARVSWKEHPSGGFSSTGL